MEKEQVVEKLLKDKKITLYLLDKAERTRIWECEVWESNGKGYSKISHGILGGAIQEVPRVIEQGKNIGKANETSPYEQIISEVAKEALAQIKSGASFDINNLKKYNELSQGYAPFLAEKYDPTMKQKGSKNFDKLKIKGKLVAYQPKFDGNRALTEVQLIDWPKDYQKEDILRIAKSMIDTESGRVKGVTSFTRKGEIFKPIPHIQISVLIKFALIAKYVKEKYGIEKYVLDGEFFTQEYSFNKLNGLLKKDYDKRTTEHKDAIQMINYHLYDVVLDTPYKTRLGIIEKYFKSDVLIPTETYFDIADEDVAKKYLEKFLEEGQEGCMIRTNLEEGYQKERSWNLLKYKTFEDQEYEVLDVIESDKRPGMAKAIQCLLHQPTLIDGKVVTTFDAALKCSHEEMRELLKKKEDLIGKKITVEYFCLSEYGIPRFPKTNGVPREDV